MPPASRRFGSAARYGDKPPLTLTTGLADLPFSFMTSTHQLPLAYFSQGFDARGITSAPPFRAYLLRQKYESREATRRLPPTFASRCADRPGKPGA